MSRTAEDGGRLKNFLKQALSRNKAVERQALWKQKHSEDHGSATSLTLKTNKGEVHNLPVIPANAEVTKNSVNKFEEERKRLASQKEDVLLDRLCDGQDHAWRPDSFFSEALGEDEVPWPVRPTDFFTNPHYADRIVAAYEASKAKAKKKQKKEKQEKKHKSENRDEKERVKLTEKEKKRKDSVDKKGKKDKNNKKKKKKQKKKCLKSEGKKKTKRKRKRSDSSSDSMEAKQKKRASRTLPMQGFEIEKAEKEALRDSSADSESTHKRASGDGAGEGNGGGDDSSSNELLSSSDLEVLQIPVAGI